jgi:hypothetical protein
VVGFVGYAGKVARWGERSKNMLARAGRAANKKGRAPRRKARAEGWQIGRRDAAEERRQAE